MIVPIILSLIAYTYAISSQSLVREQWDEFKLEYKKIYLNEDEDNYRMKIFMENMHTILEHNKLYEMGASTYKMAMNHFGDLTHEEYMRYTGVPYDNSTFEEDYEDFSQENASMYVPTDKKLPKEVDWRVLGAVTRIKDQGLCGSCYAFSATGALEAQQFKKTKTLVELSEQNIIDCTYKKKKYNNQGCYGGRVDKSFQYIIDNKGIDEGNSYPYIANRNKRCRFSKAMIASTMTSYKNIPPGNEKALQEAVALIGPVAVMVDHKNMRFYSGGIYDDPTCSSKEYTHGMVVIGYGTYRKIDYWLAKNSWGTHWGEEGYIMMMRNKKNQCAIATAALYPLI